MQDKGSANANADRASDTKGFMIETDNPATVFTRNVQLFTKVSRAANKRRRLLLLL